MSLRETTLVLLVALATACEPRDHEARPDSVSAVQADSPTPAPTAAQPRRGEPPDGRADGHADGHRGDWRLVAADDPHDTAVMTLSIRTYAGGVPPTGDFLLFQPFCDLVADRPIVGDSECELIGLNANFDRVDMVADRAVLVFHPTADGQPHRLDLRVQGAALAGEYQADGVRRAVIATRLAADGR